METIQAGRSCAFAGPADEAAVEECGISANRRITELGFCYSMKGAASETMDQHYILLNQVTQQSPSDSKDPSDGLYSSHKFFVLLGPRNHLDMARCPINHLGII